MRQAASRKVRRGAQVSQSISLPAPVGGLNARDSVANMPATDALVLDNWFPTPTSVDVRRGYASYATFTGVCETVIVYTGLTSTKVFVAVNTTNDAIIDATSGGAISTPVVGGSGPTVQALTSARFDYAIYGTTGGQYLSAVNGADTPLEYDGTTWTASANTGSGLTTSRLSSVAVYAERFWYIEKDTFNVWYLAAATKSGTLTKLNLGSLFKLGGSLNSIITLTDSTDSLNDYIGFLSTEGELVAYAGTDPSTAATWERVAHIQIGRPVTKGNRAWCKYGADALVVCADGVYPIRAAIALNGRGRELAVSDKIRDLVNADVQVNGAKFGWQVVLHPTGSKLLVNVPTSENIASRTYVMNTQTNAWCRFTNWNAVCYAVAQDQLYFGTNGVLAKADRTTDLDDDGDAIPCDAKQAFNYLGRRGQTKQTKLMRPLLAINGPCNIGVDVDVDYEDTPPTTLYALSGGSGDPWGGIWSAVWSQGITIVRQWFDAPGVGFAIAPRMKIQAQDVTLSWSATDLVYEVGSIGP